MRRYLATALLASCSLPDEVGVSANASQFDWLAQDDRSFLANDTGMGYGLGVWASWKLSRPEQAVRWSWPETPPYYLARQQPPQPISTNPVDVASTETDHVETLLDAGDRMSGWSPLMQFGGMLCLVIVVGVWTRRWWIQKKT